MAGFSLKDATLEGIRLTREQPAAVAALAVLWIGFSLLLFITLARADLLGQVLTPQSMQSLTPEAGMALMGRMLSAVSVALPVWLALFVLTQSAVMRMVLRPQERGLAFLRIGADEARLLLVTLAIGGMLFAAYIGCLILAIAAGGSPAVISLALLGAIVLCGVIAIRFSLAAPQTFATGKVALGPSLALTKGRFLPLLSAYALAFLLNLLISLLGGIIAEAVGGLLGAKEHPATLADVLSPGWLVLLALQGVFQAMTLILSLAPPARIYRDLTRTDIQA